MTNPDPRPEAMKACPTQDWLARALLDGIQFHIFAEATLEDTVKVVDGLGEMTCFDAHCAALVRLPKWVSASEAQEAVDRAFTQRAAPAVPQEVAGMVEKLLEAAKAIRNHVPDAVTSFHIVAQSATDPERRIVAGPLHADLLETAADMLAAITQQQPARGEREQIIAWLLEQSDKGAEIGIEKEKGSTARAAFGGGSYALKRAAEEIRAGAHLGADAEIVCEACTKPILRGQFVHCYTDVGEVHVDCDHPFATTDDPDAVIMAGDPLVRVRLAPPIPPEGDDDVALLPVLADLREEVDIDADCADAVFAQCDRLEIAIKAALLRQPSPAKADDDVARELLAAEEDRLGRHERAEQVRTDPMTGPAYPMVSARAALAAIRAALARAGQGYERGMRDAYALLEHEYLNCARRMREAAEAKDQALVSQHSRAAASVICVMHEMKLALATPLNQQDKPHG